jgi:tetratricopeptide (TPR) repeat protein
MEKAVSWDPNSPPFHHDLALIHSSTGNTAKAIQKLQDTIKLAPNEARYRYELGLAYSESGDLEQTVAALREARRLGRELAEYHLQNGVSDAGADPSPDYVRVETDGDIKGHAFTPTSYMNTVAPLESRP